MGVVSVCVNNTHRLFINSSLSALNLLVSISISSMPTSAPGRKSMLKAGQRHFRPNLISLTQHCCARYYYYYYYYYYTGVLRHVTGSI